MRKLARCGARLVITAIQTTRVTINIGACRVAQASGCGSRTAILPTNSPSGLHYTSQHIVCGHTATYRKARNAWPIGAHTIIRESHAICVHKCPLCAITHGAPIVVARAILKVSTSAHLDRITTAHATINGNVCRACLFDEMRTSTDHNNHSVESLPSCAIHAARRPWPLDASDEVRTDWAA